LTIAQYVEHVFVCAEHLKRPPNCPG